MPETDTGPVERIVAGTAHSWLEPHPHKAGEHVYFTARHGERITVTAEEAARGEQMGTLVDEEKARANAMTRAQLEAELARLNAELDAARASQPPAMLQPPPAPPTSTTLTPSMTGIPQPEPPPTDVGPIGATTAAAVAAARAATAGSPVISVTPQGHALTDTAPLAPDITGGSAGPAAGDVATDEQLTAMNATEVAAYVNQHSDDPDEVDRVDALEATRSRGTRKTVTDAIDAIRAAAAEHAANADQE